MNHAAVVEGSGVGGSFLDVVARVGVFLYLACKPTPAAGAREEVVVIEMRKRI